MQAFLTLPLGRTSTSRHPLIVEIHGGPHGQQGPDFNGKAQVFAAHGYAVLMVNYRGSTGYGQKFTDWIIIERSMAWYNRWFAARVQPYRSGRGQHLVEHGLHFDDLVIVHEVAHPRVERAFDARTEPPEHAVALDHALLRNCLLYTSPSPRDRQKSRMPSSA